MMPPLKSPESDEYERMTADDAVALFATDLSHGLTKEEAGIRRLRFGPNEVSETASHPVRDFLKTFWGLTAWMLESIIVLSWILRKFVDVAIVGTLLVVGYPPCPYVRQFKEFIEKRYGLAVVVGTHPIPLKYLDVHRKLPFWDQANMEELVGGLLREDAAVMEAYN